MIASRLPAIIAQLRYVTPAGAVVLPSLAYGVWQVRSEVESMKKATLALLAAACLFVAAVDARASAPD